MTDDEQHQRKCREMNRKSMYLRKKIHDRELLMTKEQMEDVKAERERLINEVLEEGI